MKSPTSALVTLSLGAFTLFASDAARGSDERIYLKLDDHQDGVILNYAGDSDATATLEQVRKKSLVRGRFEQGLRAFGDDLNPIRVDWTTDLDGALTVSFFLKNRLANSMEHSPVLSGGGEFMLFIGGDAGGGFGMKGWGGADLQFDNGTDVCMWLGWNHVGCVIKPGSGDTEGEALWYVNGTLEHTETITQAAHLPASLESLCIAADDRRVEGSLYDLDEFRVLNRAATAAEIASWSRNRPAANTTFGDSSDTGSLACEGGKPTLGNLDYALLTDGPAYGLGLMVFGFSLDDSGSMPGDAGEVWEIAFDAFLPITFNAAGHNHLGIGIPDSPALDGLLCYTQALTLSPEGGSLQATNACAHVVGH